MMGLQQRRALSDPTRLKLLKLVMREELCVCELVRLLQVSQPAVSQHLARLKALGLLQERRVGMWTYYRADPTRVEAAWAAVGALLRADVASLPAMAAEWERRRCLDPTVCRLSHRGTA